MFPCDWESATGLQLVDGAHGAFEGLGVVQRRKVLHVFDSYFILSDLLTGAGSHLCEQFFHFAGPAQNRPGKVALDPESQTARSESEGSANVVVAPVSTEGLEAAFVEAQETDMRPEDKFERSAMLGWRVTDGCFKRVKSPVLVYSQEGELPLTFCDVMLPLGPNWTGSVRPRSLAVAQGGQELASWQATALAIDIEVGRPRYRDEETRPDMGGNLALGKQGQVEVNQGSFGSDAGAALTDGDLSSRTVGKGASSGPYTPGVLLEGRFAVDFGAPTKLNTLVLHHAIWNGSSLLYAAEEMRVEFWDGATWRPVQGDRTVWSDNMVSETSFDAVETTRIGVSVRRPSGGRLAVREMEAYFVPPEELRRVEALRAERLQESWTDYVLIGHEGSVETQFGRFSTDAEVAVVRTGPGGAIQRVALRGGTHLSADGAPMVIGAYGITTLSAQWLGDTVDVACPNPAGLSVRAQAAQRLTWRGAETPSAMQAGALVSRLEPEGEAPAISDMKVEYQPAQQGLAGGQPWAVVTWKTSEPATSRVEFEQEKVGLRRTPLDDGLVTEHSVRVEFLRPGEEYEFRAVSRDRWGRPAR